MSSVATIGGFVIGAFEQLVNTVAHRVVLPTSLISPVPVGDVLEPRGRARHAGANAVESLIELVNGVHRSRDAEALRDSRPRVATATIVGGGAGTVTQLRFDADAPLADWGARGREAAMVAVYVDGVYHSTVIVQRERTGGYTVNLGALATGPHAVELRAATDLAPGASQGLRVGRLRASVLTGDAALIEAHAPILELRDVDPSARHSIARSDAPLLLVPSITTHADGTRTIEYRVVFSNEDGGTRTVDIMPRYGRAADAEPMYRVRIDAHGRVLSETYQSPVHRWLPFDGTHVGSRPVLRVSTSNNLLSTRVGAAGTERWSQATIGPVSAEASDFTIMRDHPWTWQVMAKELVREGKTAASQAVRGALQIGDPRQYIYLDLGTDARRAAIAVAGGVWVRLADGRRVFARVEGEIAIGAYRQTAIELPSGARADAVAGVEALGVRALVLDDAFLPRDLPIAA